MTFKELKDLDYNDNLPLEFVLSDLLFKEKLSVDSVMSAYSKSMHKERHILDSKFNEACTNLAQILSGNFKGEHEEELYKRCVHTFNMSGHFPSHIYDFKYKYSKEDEKRLDEDCKRMYGIDLTEK